MQLLIPWLLVMMGAFYLLAWRPQQRRMAMVRSLQSEVRQGDEVLTTSGIYARVVRLGEDDADLEIAPGTVIRVARGALGQIITQHDQSFDAPGETTEAG